MKWESICSNPFNLLKVREIYLSRESYDASKSSVEVTLKAMDSTTWKTFMNMKNTEVKSFLKLHTCRKQIAAVHTKENSDCFTMKDYK